MVDNDDTQGTDLSKTSVINSTELPENHPKPGVVLGKDGKPCRACSSSAAFTSWVSETRKASKLSQLQSQSSSHTTVKPVSDCPPDVESLGRSSWNLLHSITAAYPMNPSPSKKSDIVQFLNLFAKFYPCWVCAEDFEAYIRTNQVRADNRQELGKWMCEAHNDVNKKLGKKNFDCQKWEERWKTGWKDGSCD